MSSKDSNLESDSDSEASKAPYQLKYDAEMEETDCALKAKPQRNGVKTSLSLLRKNSIRLSRDHLKRGTCPKCLRPHRGEHHH